MCITNWFKSVLAGLGMLLLAFNVSAYPQLTFHGNMNYSYLGEQGGGSLDVQGTLTNSQDISPVPQFSGSIFKFTGLFDTVSTSTGGTTVGHFTGSSLSVIDGGPTHATLLKGDLNGLMMRGVNGSDMGVLAAAFTPTTGSLMNEFTTGAKLFAFQLNLANVFGPDMFTQNMFTQNFKGSVDGWLSSVSVPEPGVLVLFMLGLGLLLIVTRKKSGQEFSHHVS